MVVTPRKLVKPPLALDASLDSDVVFHEYGHGLTWRMIGGMSGPVSGAIGEGASDALAMLMNDDDRIAEYSVGDPLGFRRAPYTNYPRTYADWTGDEIHDDGEIYAAIVWRMVELFEAAGARDQLFDVWVDGMNYTPESPAAEDMRDGMLASAGASSDDRCRIWHAFAAYGVGVGANGEIRGSRVRVTESFALPVEC